VGRYILVICTIGDRKKRSEPDSDVGSTYPGGGEATKGLAVRQLKSYVSWVQTVVRQVGLLSTAGVEI
jgi:hypothetical protein